MQFSHPLLPGVLIQRYKRFLADILLLNGQEVTAHCPNSGSMKGCNIPGNQVMLSLNDRPERKLKYTWEMIQVNGNWVGINTNLSAKLVIESIKAKQIKELQGYQEIRPEVRVSTHSRLDLLLNGPADRCFVEVKNVTLLDGKIARFPDAVTIRGQKHLSELIDLVKKGERAVIFFVIQREDANSFAPADDIDPEYGRLLRKAFEKGVEILAYQARVTPAEIRITNSLPVKWI